ncbi:MAG: DUF748 domain-containing protein [Desulforhopalus sp.]
MTTPDGSRKQFIWRNFWRRRSVRIVALLCLLLIAVLLFLPFGTRLYLEKWLVDNGADSATIKKVRLNPFTGVAAIEGLDVKKGGQQVFSDSTIHLNIGLQNLLGRQALLQRATIVDLYVDVEKYEDGSVRVGSYTIPPAGVEELDTPPEIAGELEKEAAWIFYAHIISLKNVVVRYRQPDLEANLVIEEAILEKINTDPSKKEGTVTVKATLNEAPISLNLPSVILSPQIDIHGDVAVTDAHLNDLAEFLKEYLHPFSGTAALQGDVSFTMDDGGLDVRYDGLIDLQDGDIGGEGWATKGTVTYHGKGGFAMNPENRRTDVDGDLQLKSGAFTMPAPVINIDNPEISIKGKTTVVIGDEVIVDSGASLQLAPTTFAMDILKTATGNSSWKGAVRVETGTDTKGLLVKADGELHVAKPQYSMNVNTSLMEVDSQQLSWNGQVEYTMGVGDGDSDFVRTDGTLQGDAATFSLPEVVQVRQKGLTLNGKTIVEIGSNIGVNYDGKAVLDESDVEAAGVAVADKQLSWAGKVEYLLSDTRQSVGLTGDLSGEGILADMTDADLQFRQQSMQTKADFSLTLAESPSFTGKVSLAGKGLTINQGEAEIASVAEITLPEIKDNGSGGVIANSLTFKNLAVPSSEKIPVSVSVADISVTSIESPDLASARASRLTINNPEVVDGEGVTRLADLDSITAETISVDKELALTIALITAENGSFLVEEGKEPGVKLAKLDLANANYSPDTGFTGDTIEVDSLLGDFHRQKAADTKGEEKKTATAPPAPENTEEAAGIPVKINQVKVTGDSGFTFTDETLKETFKTVFALKSLQVNDIDLNSPSHPFSYSLEGAFDKYALLKVTGKSAPLGKNIFVEQQASLKNGSMVHISPYAVETIGTYFPTGRVDYTSTLKLDKGEIDMDNNLVFKNLEAETVNGELAGELNSRLPVSLDLALAMLRENDGTIDLDIPLKGKVSDFHIGITDIVITALSKGITTAVTPYLAYTALGPAGALVFLGSKAGGALLNTDLPSLKFAVNDDELTDEHKKILDGVGKTMEKHPDEPYTILARVSIDEAGEIDSSSTNKQAALLKDTVRKKLYEIGENRSLAVKKYLIDNFKIGEDRLLIANPEINFKKGAKPEVQFKK